jgi:hypothetical protein
MLKMLLFTAAASVVLAACGMQVDRAAAIEACHLANSILDPVPNPLAGQERRSALGRPLGGPTYEPNFLRPTPSDIRQRIVTIRSRAATSRDRQLQSHADSLALTPRDDGGWLIDTGPMRAYCSGKGY